MRSRKKKERGFFLSAAVQRCLRFLMIPLIIIILILVIIIADRTPKPKETEEQTTAAIVTVTSPDSSEESVEPDNNKYVQNFEQYELKKDEIPEINALMEAYCQAKVSCDAETMYGLYGKEDLTGVEELRAKMQLRAKYIESFQNITCYTKQGLDENSYLVYVSADIKFRVTDTLAPNLMWCYVTKGADGQYTIMENITDEIAAYVEEIERSEDVRLLAAQINARLEEAAATDTKLASAYGMLKEGTTFAEVTEIQETQTEEAKPSAEAAPETETSAAQSE